MPLSSLSPAKPSSACQFCESCTDCGCGPDCRCSETLCQCQASALLNSINFSLSLYKAEWKIDMHCQSCVRVTQNVLGDQAAINFPSKSASLIVNSEEEAQELTEALLDVGLDTTLVKVVRLDHVSPKSCSRNAKKAAMVSPLISSRNDAEDPESLSLLQSTSEPSHDPLAPLPSNPSPSATRSIELAIGGMTCSMCSKAITHTLQQLRGVQKVDVSLATNMATVVLTPSSTITYEQLHDAVESVGYTAHEILPTEASSKIQQMQDSQQADVVRKKQSFLLSLVGTLPISIMTMILPHFHIPWLHSTATIRGHVFLQESLLLAALGTLVQFGSGWTFYKTSYNNIVSGQLGMDVLVAVGTTASYVYAWIQTWKGQEAHAFETSAVLISFVLLGKWMNSLAVRRTSEALTQLMKLQSKIAILVMPDGTEETVPVEQIHPGDTVRIRRGASLPADGVVSMGYMTVDESMMTGESMPILKTPGSLVLGGTVCTESDGALVVVTGVGANTALAQIVQLVQDAQTRQVPIQDLADTISSIFVPTVCTLAVLTFVVWFILCKTGVVPPEWYQDEGDVTFSLMFAIACLVISCPCALGLATPTAVMVGTGVAAKFGVLMKGGETLEMASKVNAVVFDKTGTLTINRPTISDFIMVNGGVMMKREDLLWLFASLERNAEHPLAVAVVAFALEQLDDDLLDDKPLRCPVDFVAKTGRGAKGVIDGRTVAIGNRPYIKEMAEISPEVESNMQLLEEAGKTAILACVDNEVKVVMGIADELKADAASTLRYLQDRMGIEVWMVTGDNARTATAIANQLGLSLDRVISEALPVAKVLQVKKLQREGKMVCMVGDGINDSAAMTQANVGISLATGAEIAIEAADMVLVREGHVQEVVTALHLSRVLFRRIQLNLVFSLIYNCLGIPVAAGVFYPVLQVRLPPTLAAVAMALSSLSVVASSLALRLYRPPKLEGEPGMFQRCLRRRNNATTPVSNTQVRVDIDMGVSTPPESNGHGLTTDDDLAAPLLPRDGSNDVC